MANKQRYYLGADPEVFVYRDNKIVPVCGLVGGTKDEPIKVEMGDPIPGSIGNYAYQEDGVAFEFNIPAATSARNFESHIRAMKIWMTRFLGDKGLEWRSKPQHKFTLNQLVHPSTQIIGCDPDMWAYKLDGAYERKPFTIEDLGTTRYCGGHIHLGYNREDVPSHIMAQLVDLFVTIPFLKHDKQGGRREKYGLPGVYRDKPYGIEYRTFSNFWVADKFPLQSFSNCLFELMSLTGSSTEMLVNLYRATDWERVKRIITDEDVKASGDVSRNVMLFLQANATLPLPFLMEALADAYK